MTGWAVPVLLAATQGVTEAYSVITPELIRAHVEYLASDALRGRGAGQHGGELAARYIETQFKRLRLQPGAGDEGYLQTVSFARTTGDDGSTLTYQGPEGVVSIALGLGFRPDGACPRPETVEGPLAYVGYAISAPEADYDDLAGFDLTGKVALALWGAPKDVVEEGAGWRAHPALKAAAVRARGARGLVLAVRDPVLLDLLGRMPWAAPPSGLPAGWSAPDAIVSDSVARAILAAAEVSADTLFHVAAEGDARPVDVGGTLTITKRPRFQPAEAWNVVAVLPGRDPAKQTQAVVFTAAYDALGVLSASGDSIYNGASTASGIAKLLALAEALSAYPGGRTIVLVATAGGPYGRLGAWAYTTSPRWALDETVAAVSLEGGLDLHGLPRSVALSGGSLSDLQTFAERAARIVALRIARERRPEEPWPLGTSHYAFLQSGIPAVSARSGAVFEGHDEEWGEELRRRYYVERAFTPADETQTDFDYRGPAAIAQWAYVLARSLADGEATPKWGESRFPSSQDKAPACPARP